MSRGGGGGGARAKGKAKASEILMAQAPCIPVNSKFPLSEYYDRAERLMRQAMIYRAGQDQYNLFVIQARFSSLLLDTIPKHQQFKQLPQNRERYKKLNEPLCRAISELESLKNILDEEDKRRRSEKSAQNTSKETPSTTAAAAAAAAPAGNTNTNNTNRNRNSNDLPLVDLSIGSKERGHDQQPVAKVPSGPVDLLTATETELAAAAAAQRQGSQGSAGMGGMPFSSAATSSSSGSGRDVSFDYPTMDTKPLSAPMVPEVRSLMTPAPAPAAPSMVPAAASAPAIPPPPPLSQASAPPPPPPPHPHQQTNGVMHPMPPPPPPPPQQQQQQYGDFGAEPQMTAHKPKVVQNMPTKEVADMDYVNLADRLKHYGLKEKKVRGDGNCQFRSLSDQLFGTPDRHEEVRRMAISQLKNKSDLYKPYIPEDYDEYVDKMSKDGEWGDHVTLQAAADIYGKRICVLSSYKTSFIIDIKPQKTLHSRVLWLSFWAEVHYNSLYPSGSLD